MTNLIIHAITIQNPKRNDTVQLRIHENGMVSVKFINHVKTQLFQKEDAESLAHFLTEYFFPRERIRIIALLTKERQRHLVIKDVLNNISNFED